MKKVVIIGGGPAGMMAAISAKMHHSNSDVTIIEGNNELGVKMKLSGGGRCNVTADVKNEDVIKNVVKNGKFLYSSIALFGPVQIQQFFEDNGCELKVEDHDRVFPKSNDANDIVAVLRKKLVELEVKICYNTRVKSIKDKQLLCDTKTIEYDSLIVASGGKTYVHTGSDGSGYTLAETLGHTITPLLPAEVPLVSNDEVIQSKELQGLSFKDCTVSVNRGKKVIKSINHDVIFTHFGLSGPAALRASFYVLKELEKQETVPISIDFLPTKNIEQLQQEYKLESDSSYFINQGISKRLLKYIGEHTNNTQEFILMLKKFPLNIYATRGFANAFVTNGGVQVKEVDPKTMKSKLNSSVSFCGEVLDINAFTGGFNITAALSTGYNAGKNIYE